MAGAVDMRQPDTD